MIIRCIVYYFMVHPSLIPLQHNSPNGSWHFQEGRFNNRSIN